MEDRNYSEQVASTIDQEVSKIIDDCYQRAKQLLTDHDDEVRRVVVVLLEKETLSGEEIRALMRGEELPATPVPAPVQPPSTAVTPPADTGIARPGEQPQPA